jgi:Flp pilus assembly protein TadG
MSVGIVSGRRSHSRAVTAVVVMVAISALLGFAALTIDVAVIYNTRADLQRAADAGAITAALSLSNNEFSGSPVETARDSAVAAVEQNPVLGQPVTVDPLVDVVFGRGNYDAGTNTYNFAPTTIMPDAVRVTVRMTADSPNGSAKLCLAPVFGKSVCDIEATAVASISPRDMAISADLSGSLRFDSLLRYYQSRAVNNYEIWDALPGGADDTDSVWQIGELPTDLDQAAGPAWGFFKWICYGSDVTAAEYNPSYDAGLVTLQKGYDWADPDLESYLISRGYSAPEIEVIMSSEGGDDDDDGPVDPTYVYRVAAALGLAHWNSGIPGGLWETLGVPPADAGDGNFSVSDLELVWDETLMGRSAADSSAIWQQYINFMTGGTFQYRFGVKTVVDFLMERRVEPWNTPELIDTPLQPLQSVKDAVSILVDLLEDIEAVDQLSLEAYSRVGAHEVNLTTNFQSVSDRLNDLGPRQYGSGTNIGDGIKRSIEELTGPRSRASARKVIVLLTDGQANRDEAGNSTEEGGRAYALAQAQAAADLGMQIITISVGYGADQTLMEEIATIGHGTHFHAEGSIEQYTTELQNIFTQVGLKRPVALIE